MREYAQHARALYEPDYEHGSALCNGRCVPIDQGAVLITDPGFLHADAAYDVVTVSRGSFFRLEVHLSRMERSCERFLLSNPYSRDQVREIHNNLVAKSGMKDAYVWWSVTRGVIERPGRRVDPTRYDIKMYAFVAPYFFQAGDETRNRGFSILISKRYRRIPPESVDPTAENFHWMDMKLVRRARTGQFSSVPMDISRRRRAQTSSLSRTGSFLPLQRGVSKDHQKERAGVGH